MSKFYVRNTRPCDVVTLRLTDIQLPSSTTESTTSQSPITSPQSLPRHVGSGPMAPFRQLPTRTNDVSASYFPPSTAALVSDLSTPADYSLNDSDSDPDDLPYPLPLARDPFLAPDFDAATYLSTLRNRHQTLEDLRTELRQRAKALGVELVDLVNAEYEDLMGVGAMLGGGEERIEGVRVGVLGFKRELETLRAAVEGRKGEAGRALEERRRLRGELVLGRRLLEVGERVEELERRLVVLDKGDIEVEEEEEGEEGTDEDAENGDGDGDDDALRRLKTTVGLWVQLKARIELVGQHPFFDAQADRLKAIREALLLDLAAALKAARRDEARAVLLKVLGLYRDIGEAQEGIKALKGR